MLTESLPALSAARTSGIALRQVGLGATISERGVDRLHEGVLTLFAA